MIVINLVLPYPAPPTHCPPSSASKPSFHLHVLSLLLYYFSLLLLLLYIYMNIHI